MTDEEALALRNEIDKAFRGKGSPVGVSLAAQHIGVSEEEVVRMAERGDLSSAQKIRGKWFFSWQETFGYKYHRQQKESAAARDALHASWKNTDFYE